MNNDLLELTIVIVTYKTNADILKNCLNSIDTKIKTLVVENSNHFENKKKIEDQFSNVKVLCTGSKYQYNKKLFHFYYSFCLFENTRVTIKD